ncbi:MAG TPA: hypothetical protein ENK36_06835 [Desulfobacterales bacterium]|nr:hypothetical protein [Desulfobacterales bacterium]
MPAKEKLENILETYGSLKEISDSAKGIIMREPGSSFARRIISPEKAKRKKRREDAVDDYFDSLQKQIKEYCILDMITTFEQVVFAKIDNAYGEIKSTVKKEYKKRGSKDKPAPLYNSAPAFIKTKADIHNLSGAKKLLEKQISQKSFNDLTEIIEYRNWLSHGKRNTVGKYSKLSLDEIYEIFVKILDEIQ